MPTRIIASIAVVTLTLLSGSNSPCLADNTAWSIDEVVRIAVAGHPLVSQVDAEILAAGARKGQAESAYYPSVGIATGYTRYRSFNPVSHGSSTVNSEYLQGTMSLTITDFGRTGAAVDRADALLSSVKETGKSIRADVEFAAKAGYYNVLRAQRVLDVSRETARQRESLLRQAQAYYGAGIRARIDVARAEANLFQARAELTAAENDLQVARITLLNRMGIESPRDFQLKDTLANETYPGTLEEWVKEAEAGRPELRAFLERERAAEMALRAARAGYRPILTGTGGYGYAADEFPLQENFNVTVQLSFPVFSGFITRQQVAETQAQLSAARFAVTDYRRLVRLQVEQAALAVRSSREQSDARRKEREASGENLRLATGRYEVGAGDIIEMIDAQVQMSRSDTQYIDTLYGYSVSVAALQRAIGK